MKKTILVLSILSLCATAQAQLVTNMNVELVWDQSIDNIMQEAWRADRVARTNGIMPYADVQPTITYKQFLTLKVSWIAQNAAPQVVTEMNQMQQATLAAAIANIQATNAALYQRIYRIAVKGTE